MPSSLDRRRRSAIAAAVLGGHACVLLVLLWSDALRGRAVQEPTDARLAVFLVTPPLQVPPPPAPPEAIPRTRRVAPAPDASRPRAPPPVGEDLPDSALDAPGSHAIHPPARIDWDRAAREAATAAARAPGAVPDCEPTGRPDATRPRCPRRGRDFEWRPEEPKAGFKGPLPYVRLGKRCMVMPPFFACGVGKLPEANGELFDGMRDADRERSSVPEPPR